MWIKSNLSILGIKELALLFMVLSCTLAEQKTMTVAITGGAGQIAYSLIPLIGSGRTFGENVRINLKLIDVEPFMEKLAGVSMEIQD